MEKESEFNARKTLAEIREARAVRRKQKTWVPSKIEKYLAELFQLKDAGASLADMQYWLLKEKQVKIDCSNIKRLFDKYKSVPEQG